MIVLDVNILIRAVLGKHVGQLLEKYSVYGVRFYAPDTAFSDAEEYLPSLLRKKGKADCDLQDALAHLRKLVEPVDREYYCLFEEDARMRLRDRDEEDWPVLATALAFACGIWTEDTDFFGTGIAIWTTGRIEIFLRSQLEQPD